MMDAYSRTTTWKARNVEEKKPDERSGRGEDSFAAAVEEERVADIVEGLGRVDVGGGFRDFEVDRENKWEE